jgi:hypothetical protein
MTEQKQPMQADGEGSSLKDRESVPSAGRPDMNENAGQSGGGAYPHPKNDPEEAEPEDGFMGHGGQSDMRYYGGSQLGTEDIGEQPNAPTKDED